MKMFVRLFAFLGIVASAPLLRAQLTITVTAHLIDGDQQGYDFNTLYTFIFTSGTTFGNTNHNSHSLIGTAGRDWREELASDDQLWTSVTGTGLHGSFVRPTGADDPFSIVGTYSSVGHPSYFEIFAGKQGIAPATTGLKTLAGTPLSFVWLHSIEGDGGMPNFDYYGTNPSFIKLLDYF